ncbi:hypothetical protein EMIHUDRAFT_202346 [Emiliania huxleyi CCMP1516]|uniref:Uncharacterized protein n=2 Tax=Emiliania huxleyi TaxID=2903 RepID=A0A0D3KBL6_EMIH1|nr:hypothetical protein EMIHUDRAFT_202346 [Emiliania huxleyi CCMP1516]EOD33151.1 hypothetical protein EMIHUDRAFT_202346 [Emiliania huxleyi CCMP1516]|eukprot:XP_005785580.1 hypothetical protein EMIHUDRAFT_202346 [Emiliania huxleyi CCMP1516]
MQPPSPFCFGSSAATRQSWRSRPAVRTTALQPDDVTAAEMEAFMHLLESRFDRPPDDGDIAHDFTPWLAARRESLRAAADAGRSAFRRLREADAEAHGEAPHAPHLVADAKFAFEVALHEQQPAGALHETYRRLAAALAHSRRTRAGLALRHLALCPACSDALCFPAQHLPAVASYTLPPVVQRAGCSDCDYLAVRRMLAARTSSYNECTAKDTAEWLRGLEQADAVKHAWGVVVVDEVNRPPHAATRRAIMEGRFDHDSFCRVPAGDARRGRALLWGAWAAAVRGGRCANAGRAAGRADAGRADDGRADDGRADPGRADPGRADPGRRGRGSASRPAQH